MAGFVLVVVPHRGGGEAFAFQSEGDLVKAWREGMFRRFNAAGGEGDYCDAIDDIRHDVQRVLRIDSVDELDDITCNYQQCHGLPLSDMRNAAEWLSWQ